MFIIFKTDYLKVWFLLQKKIFELSELNTKSRKTTSSSISLIKEWFQGNRFHFHAIFAWRRITWNYAYSPFKDNRKKILWTLNSPCKDYFWIVVPGLVSSWPVQLPDPSQGLEGQPYTQIHGFQMYL